MEKRYLKCKWRTKQENEEYAPGDWGHDTPITPRPGLLVELELVEMTGGEPAES